MEHPVDQPNEPETISNNSRSTLNVLIGFDAIGLPIHARVSFDGCMRKGMLIRLARQLELMEKISNEPVPIV